MKDEIWERILKVFERCGVEVSLDGDEVNIKEMDSFIYITTLVELENEFSIEIPDSYLGHNIFSSMESLCDIIMDLGYK